METIPHTKNEPSILRTRAISTFSAVKQPQYAKLFHKEITLAIKSQSEGEGRRDERTN